MKVNTSYALPGRRISRYTSIPLDNKLPFRPVVDYWYWLADQTDPRIEILES